MAARRNHLAHYRQKRDFSKTPEPEGIASAQTGHRYLIQKHDATRLHYDFRLELDGVLKSWAVTKGPSLDPNDKRLAVEVEDHPVAYGNFEGIIPKGQYGGGTVMLWDEGTWEPINDPRKGLKAGKLEFQLHGNRLKGEWTLVRMNGREKDKGRHHWLLIKHKDKEARVGDNGQWLEKNKTSVVSGRSMEKIAGAEDRVWQSKMSNTDLPKFQPPQLATLTDALPKGKGWVHEVKFDGYRALAYIDHGKAMLYTRTGQDWTAKFAPLPALLAKLKVDNAILDGEIVALNDHKISSFAALQKALSDGNGNALQYYVFDLVFLNGADLRGLSLVDRKEKLQALLQKPLAGQVFYSEHFTDKDEAFLKHLCQLQMEGVVSKRADAAYENRRSKSWLKTKCHKRQEFVIGGFTLPTHAERGVGALLIGYYEEEQVVYAGKVGTGFDNETSLRLRKKLDALAQEETPFIRIAADGRRGAHWVKPALVCEIEFTEWTEDGRLRHPSFQGLREDKPAKYVGRDVPVSSSRRMSGSKAKASVRTSRLRSRRKAGMTIGGITISHPDRIVYPGTSITKGQLAEYYLAVADRILPHVANRPLSMLRCPEGIGAECFFQRHIARGQSPYLHDTGIKVKGRNESYLMIEDVKGLITLVQWGVIELHPWGCLADAPEKPDRIVFDLDPDPALPWKYVIEGAREIRERMQELSLKSFVKTTGGKGLHVVVPMVRRYGWPAVKAFARAIAESMEHDHPQRYIAKAAKAARQGKIFVDYLRNDLTATAVAAYSARAREHATVALPMAWEALTPALSPQDFTIETMPAYVKKQNNDPWKLFFKTKQAIAAGHLRALRITPE